MMNEKTVQEARAADAGLTIERRTVSKKLEDATQKLNAKMRGDNMPEGLHELRAESDTLTERCNALPDLIVDARNDLIVALRAERKSTGIRLDAAKIAALDDLGKAIEDFSKARDQLEKKILDNTSIQIILEQLPSKDGQIVFDEIFGRAFQNFSEPEGTTFKTKIERHLTDRLTQLVGSVSSRIGREIESLRLDK